MADSVPGEGSLPDSEMASFALSVHILGKLAFWCLFLFFLVCIYLAALGLSCSMQDLCSLVAACELLVGACEI